MHVPRRVLLLCCAVQFSFGACSASSTKCPSLIMRVSAVHVTSKRVSVEKHRDCRWRNTVTVEKVEKRASLLIVNRFTCQDQSIILLFLSLSVDFNSI